MTEHFYHLPYFGEDWFTYKDLYAYVVRRFPSGSHFVELGCWKGRSTAFMTVEIINSQKAIRLDCVDSWPAVYQGASVGQPVMDMFLENISPVKHAINVIRKDTADTALHYSDKSVDFVFVDADHTREGAKRDIEAWLPKLTPHGIMAGHDYSWDGVRGAVAEIFGPTDFTSPWNGADCWMLTIVDGKATPFTPVDIMDAQVVDRTSLLNFLIEKYQYTSYLELGVDKGENFAGINLVDKVGVDIRRPATFRMSTDKYFRTFDRKFDIVFIDADHEAEQTYRDFENSLQHLNDHGCIVFHDCLPKTEVHQLRRRQSNQWTGNVWKAFIRVRQRADVNAFVLDADWGLGIVFKQPNTDQLPRIRPLDWETFVNRGTELLRVIQPEQLLNTLPAR